MLTVVFYGGAVSTLGRRSQVSTVDLQCDKIILVLNPGTNLRYLDLLWSAYELSQRFQPFLNARISSTCAVEICEETQPELFVSFCGVHSNTIRCKGISTTVVSFRSGKASTDSSIRVSGALHIQLSTLPAFCSFI